MVLKKTQEVKTEYFIRGERLKNEGKLEEACAEYRRDIEKKPNTAAYDALGGILTKQGEVDEAISCYQEALKIKPASHQIYIKLGYLLIINCSLDEALTCYLKAIELKPNLWQAHSMLRRVRWNLSQTEQIIIGLKKVAQLHPDSIFPYVSLGYILPLQGKINEAVIYIQNASNENVIKSKPNIVQDKGKLLGSRKPDFIVIGSAKSGTTSLYQYLIQHPQILPAITKEIGFFDTKRYSNGIDWYLSHFPQLTDGKKKLTGEATPSYLHRYGVPEKLFELLPHAKLIVILRNPVERTISAYHHSKKDNAELRSLIEVIDSEITLVKGVSDPSEVMNPSHRRKVNYRFEPRYLVWSLYYYFLKKWINIFPREQFLILNSNDFYAKTPEVMDKVFDFLGLPNNQLAEYPIYTAGNYASIDNELTTKLSNFFQPHNQKLEEYLGIKFNWD